MTDQPPPDPGYDPTIPLPITDGPADPPPPYPPTGGGPVGSGGDRNLRPWLIAAVVLLALLVVLVLVLLLGGGDDDDEPETTLPPETTSSTVPDTTTTSTTAAPQTTTTAAPASTTAAPTTTSPPTTTAATGPRVTQASITAINCPNPVVLTWSTVNATRVEIAIDSPGGVFDSGPANGSMEVPAPCGDDTQTYYVTAIDALNDRSTRVLTCTENDGCSG